MRHRSTYTGDRKRNRAITLPDKQKNSSQTQTNPHKKKEEEEHRPWRSPETPKKNLAICSISVLLSEEHGGGRGRGRGEVSLSFSAEREGGEGRSGEEHSGTQLHRVALSSQRLGIQYRARQHGSCVTNAACLSALMRSCVCVCGWIGGARETIYREQREVSRMQRACLFISSLS